jgi:hypothetical protein
MLMLFMLAEAASTPPAPSPADGQKCVIVAQYKMVPTVTGFGTASAAYEQSRRVSRIISPPPESVPGAKGKLPEKAELKAEPAVESPKCFDVPPAGVMKRRKNERLG